MSDKIEGVLFIALLAIFLAALISAVIAILFRLFGKRSSKPRGWASFGVFLSVVLVGFSIYILGRYTERSGSVEVFDAIETSAGICILMGRYEGLTTGWDYQLLYVNRGGGVLTFPCGAEERLWKGASLEFEREGGIVSISTGEWQVATFRENPAELTVTDSDIVAKGEPFRSHQWTRKYLAAQD
ncbi:MAG: hypothetical protein JKY61_09740 [Planctomycetes bacterium]|nr:hypothetical protein [Planctomycetota bacterium]